MAIIPSTTFKQWKNGEVINALEYVQELEILRTAINSNGTDIAALKGLTVGELRRFPSGTSFPGGAIPGDIFYREDLGQAFYLGLESQWHQFSLESALTAHATSTENPHKVSAVQLGVYTKEESQAAFAAKTQEAEKFLTLLNSWQNAYDSQKARYWKDSVGMVHLNGRVKSGTMTEGTTLCILPSGYRPKDTIYVEARGFRLQILSTGDVKIYGCETNIDNGIDNIHFRAYN